MKYNKTPTPIIGQLENDVVKFIKTPPKFFNFDKTLSS